MFALQAGQTLVSVNVSVNQSLTADYYQEIDSNAGKTRSTL
ncbi:hypothetical protein L21SP2_1816 [Salinispira pacifica]|uniref:Uncharacterized protein n=1 Tax=Salinispira pacifica TaxID=1307761 RepID=V5WJ47_9SPIO|nr:hypothetical protein L21SP2_1816 [Salinispira pacifica]